MTDDNPPRHSGSRWEPPTTTDLDTGRTIPTAALGMAPAAARPGAHRRRHRRRGRLLAVLVAVLTLGASTAGFAYVQSAQELPTRDHGTVADSRHDHGPGVGEGDDDGRWGDHHHDGDRGNDGPGARGGDDDGAADDTTGELPS